MALSIQYSVDDAVNHVLHCQLWNLVGHVILIVNQHASFSYAVELVHSYM